MVKRKVRSSLQAWLDLLCQMIPRVSGGIVVENLSVAAAPSACWPDEGAATEALLAAVQLAGNRETPLLHPGNPDSAQHTAAESICAYPLRFDDQLIGVVAIQAQLEPSQHAVVQQLMVWGQAWLGLIIEADSQATLGSHQLPANKSQVLQAVFDGPDLQQCLQLAADALASAYACERVGIGLASGAKVRLRALSDTPRFDSRMQVVRQLESRMSAALSESWPHHINPKGDRLTLRLMHQREPVGLFVLERGKGGQFSPLEATQLADLVAPLSAQFALRQALEKPLLAHLPSPSALFQTAGATPKGLHKRWGLVVAALVALLFLSVPGDFRVSAPARLEGKVERAVVSPFDGYIKHSFKRAGETVAEAEVIAELDNRDLLLEQSRLSSQKGEQLKQYRQALAAMNRAQASIYQAQIAQSEAQLALLEEHLQRAKLVAPLDGIVIAGDLSRSLGAPVERGQVLFEVAPLDEYRLVLMIDEGDVGQITPGLRGHLSLRALPGQPLPFQVERVSTVFDQEDGKARYRTEARVEADTSLLRPGMQGIGKVTVDRRAYIRILFHDIANWMKLRLWQWTP